VQKVSSVAERQDKLKALDAAIAERTKYLRDQEKLINDLVEAGNTQLMGLAHDIAVAKQLLLGLKTDIRTMARDKVLLNEDLEQIRQEIRITVVEVDVAPAFG
jgi:chromosome segregation ATPase